MIFADIVSIFAAMVQQYLWSCLTFDMCLFATPIKTLRKVLPGELRLAPYAPSPGWHAFQVMLSISAKVTAGVRPRRLFLQTGPQCRFGKPTLQKRLLI